MNRYKVIIAAVLLFAAVFSDGCRESRYNIINEKKSNMSIAAKDYGDHGEGYIMNIEDNRFLVVGTNLIEEYDQLNAVWVTIFKSEEIFEKLDIGKKVSFVSDGPTLTSYPGIGGIKITDVIGAEYPGAKSAEMDIIRRTLDVVKDISDSKNYLCGVNDVEFSDGIWKVVMIKHETIKDELTYYNVEINDGSKKIEEIIEGR